MINSEQLNKLDAVEVPPSLDNLYNLVVPALGHSTIDALADIVDNSLDAQAKNTHIHLGNTDGKIDRIMIIDDGSGMDRYTLIESYRFSTDIAHTQGDLGKYGLGGTTGCFTLAACKHTLTKIKGGDLFYAIQDLSVSTGVKLGLATKEQREFFNQYCKNESGTIIILTQVKELDYKTAGRLKNKIVSEFRETFYSYINQNRNIYVSVGDNKPIKIGAKDPLLFNQPELLEWSHKKDITYNGQMISLRMCIVKTNMLSEDGSKSYQKQGVYLNRNGRLIHRGGSLKNVWKIHPAYNTARIEVYFGEESDFDFGLKATKNGVAIKQGLADTLTEEVNFLKQKAMSLAKKAPNSDSQKKELREEETAYSEKLKKKAGLFGLPLQKKQKRGESENPRTGTVVPTGTGSPKTPRSRIIPRFEHVYMPQNPNHVYYDYGDSDSVEDMKIIINLSHSFNIQHYTNGSQETKDAMRKIWVANCIAMNQHFGTSTYEVVDCFRNDVAGQLKKLQDVL